MADWARQDRQGSQRHHSGRRPGVARRRARRRTDFRHHRFRGSTPGVLHHQRRPRGAAGCAACREPARRGCRRGHLRPAGVNRGSTGLTPGRAHRVAPRYCRACPSTPPSPRLPLEEVRGAALERALALGCSHAEVRIERIRSQVVVLRDGRVETTVDDTEIGMGLRVVRDGSIGFAATVELHPDAAAELADRAVAMAGGHRPGPGRPRRSGRRAGLRRRCSGRRPTRSIPTTVAVADKVAAPRGVERAAPGPRGRSTTSPPTSWPWWRTSTSPTCRAR